MASRKLEVMLLFLLVYMGDSSDLVSKLGKLPHVQELSEELNKPQHLSSFLGCMRSIDPKHRT